MSKIHVFPDENLGGVLREYIEVDRKAEVGEYIFTINTKEIHKVTKGSEDGVYIDGWVYVYDGYYRTLEQTDIVHVDGQRYRLVDRKAKVGEKVIVVVANGSLVYRNVGEIVEIIETDGDTFGGLLNPYDLGEKGAIYHFQYLVLEPVEPVEEGDDVLTVDETEASKSVLDLLANLAQRVTELERQQKENDDEYTVEERVARLERTFTEYMRRVNTIETDIEELNIDLGTVEENVEMILDDIVTLDERTQPLEAFVKAVKGDE
jgi:hypothetical protein